MGLPAIFKLHREKTGGSLGHWGSKSVWCITFGPDKAQGCEMIRPKIIRPKVIKPTNLKKIIRPNLPKKN